MVSKVLELPDLGDLELLESQGTEVVENLLAIGENQDAYPLCSLSFTPETT